MQKNLEIGQIVNTFGIKGFVKVKPFVNDVSRFDDLEEVFVKSKKDITTYKVEEVKYQKNVVLVKLKGIDTVERAETLRNSYMEVDREHAIELEEGEYFIADVLGSKVVTDEGEELGFVDDIYNTGSNDIYVVKNELGKQILLPSIPEVILDVNVEESKVTVHIIDGLLN